MKFLIRIIFFIFNIFTLTTTQAQTQPQKLTISHLTQNFYIYTTYGDAGNGNMFPANGMYLVTEKGVVLFDTPWDTTQFQPLLDSIKVRHHKNVIMCISTHFHDDRTAGLNYYKQKGIATYSTKQTDELARNENNRRAEFLIYSDTTFNIGEYSFQTFYPGKGHTADNIVIWFGKEKILYGGCFIKSTETSSLGNLADADTEEWIISAEKVKSKYHKPKYIIPGHQSWENKNSLRHTIKLLEQAKRKTGNKHD